MKKIWNKIVELCYKLAKASGIVCILMIVGCGDIIDTPTNGTCVIRTYDAGRTWRVKVLEIEGCEYVSYGESIVHKANCKNHQPDTVYIPVPSEEHSKLK